MYIISFIITIIKRGFIFFFFKNILLHMHIILLILYSIFLLSLSIKFDKILEAKTIKNNLKIYNAYALILYDYL